MEFWYRMQELLDPNTFYRRVCPVTPCETGQSKNEKIKYRTFGSWHWTLISWNMFGTVFKDNYCIKGDIEFRYSTLTFLNWVTMTKSPCWHFKAGTKLSVVVTLLSTLWCLHYTNSPFQLQNQLTTSNGIMDTPPTTSKKVLFR